MSKPKLGHLNLPELIFGTSRRVAHIRRFSSIPVNRQENVAEHSWFVSLYSVAIARDYERRTEKKLDIERLLIACIVHDIDESITGDVLRSVKHGNDLVREAFEAFSKEVAKDIQDRTGFPFLEYWVHSKDATPEGFILAAADLLSVVSYSVEELRSGNSNIYIILAEARGWLAKMAEKFKDANIDPLLFNYVRWAIELIKAQEKKWDHLKSRIQLIPGRDYEFVEFNEGDWNEYIEEFEQDYGYRPDQAPDVLSIPPDQVAPTVPSPTSKEANDSKNE